MPERAEKYFQHKVSMLFGPADKGIITRYPIITLERISEEFMLPALRRLLNTFPFKIKGFHADNGSEYFKQLYERLKIRA
ncbi:MAG: hypothetical protein KUG80_09095 [Gammaproteobacteria bacterium]|nr:hypothetical protein [Gammaproteobacteria bacterium]